MKKTLLLFISVFAAFMANAQITIDSANHPTPYNVTQRYQAISPTGLSIPKHGSNMSWDYGSVSPLAGEIYSTNYSKPVNPKLNTASRTYIQNLFIGPDSVTSTIYLTNNSKGYSYSGYTKSKRQAYLIPQSGGDSVIFPVVDSVETANPQYILKYPAAYNSNWSYKGRLTNHFLLYDGTYGIYLQGYQIIRRTVIDSVVGSGNMMVPVGVSASGASKYYPVIMVKEQWIDIDSFAIQDLSPTQVGLYIAAFGLKQGDTVPNYSYTFYRAGQAAALMSFNTDPTFSKIISAGYDPDSTTLATGILRSGLINTEAKVYPNPVTSSNIEFTFVKQDNAKMMLNIANSLGQVVQSVAINQEKGNIQMQLTLPANLANGIYYYNITEPAGNGVLNGKFILNR